MDLKITVGYNIPFRSLCSIRASDKVVRPVSLMFQHNSSLELAFTKIVNSILNEQNVNTLCETFIFAIFIAKQGEEWQLCDLHKSEIWNSYFMTCSTTFQEDV